MLPQQVMWKITMCTAVGMALANCLTIFIISTIVEWKFSMMQSVINDHGVILGVLALLGIVTTLAALCSCLVTFVATGAGGSGAPENKGWLNGNHIPGLFTWQNLFGRAIATILANTAGYPVGREGPTVTMGSNLAFLLTHTIALPHVQQWIDVHSPGSETATVVDEERFSHAKRIACTVGGACGMSMLFDSPIGGIVYMFEEITSASWPLELTFRAFAATIVCALVSRALMQLCGTNFKAFVVYEWHPRPQSWSWTDMPFFLLLAAFLGPFSAFHTRACLYVATLRGKFMSRLKSRSVYFEKYGKMADAIFYSTLCATTYACISIFAQCHKQPYKGLEYVRFNCEEDFYNPVASLLLTTTDAAVKRLFSTKNASKIQWSNELLAFFAYTGLNIGLTGIPVPSGNFTGSMLIGGLAGRIMGCLVRHLSINYHLGITTESGVYAMIGSAAMLCGFKQMSVAVVIFITGCANDLNLVPPLMMAVAVSLFLNKLINERGFDEEQIARKKIPFLTPELPLALDTTVALELIDMVPEDAILPPKATLERVKRALNAKNGTEDVQDFPVVKENRVCVGFTTRDRLEAALKSREEGSQSPIGPLVTKPRATLFGRYASNDGEDEIRLLLAEDVGKKFRRATHLPVYRLADRVPHMIPEDMTAPRFYGLFAHAGVRAASVVNERGVFRGMISRRGLITKTRQAEHGEFPEKLEVNNSHEEMREGGDEEDDTDTDTDQTQNSGDDENGLLDFNHKQPKLFGPL